MDTVVLHADTLRIIADLPPEDVKAYLQAIVTTMEGDTAEVPPHLKIGWSFIYNGIKLDADRYAEKCEKRRENANKRWHANDAKDAIASNCMQNMQLHDSHANDAYTYTNTKSYTNTYTKTNTYNREGDKSPSTILCKPNPATPYPSTADDILNIAKTWNVVVTREQAENYLAYRSRDDWQIPRQNGTMTKIPASKIGSDLKIWMNREKQRNTQNSKESNRDGKSIPSNDYGSGEVPSDIVF